MKKLLKAILFKTGRPNKIFSGVSSGMLTNYGPNDRTLHLLGLYEREIYPYLNRSIAGAETLIDIGANDGYYGLAFAKYKGKEIILCEPSDQKDNLRKNLLLNGFKENKDYMLVDKFVSDGSDETDISINELIMNKKKVFILMDVDGGEQQIIENCKFPPDIKIDWLIETHSAQLEENVRKVLLSNGYKIKIIDSAWWRFFFPEKRPLAHNRWMYAIKD